MSVGVQHFIKYLSLLTMPMYGVYSVFIW